VKLTPNDSSGGGGTFNLSSFAGSWTILKTITDLVYACHFHLDSTVTSSIAYIAHPFTTIHNYLCILRLYLVYFEPGWLRQSHLLRHHHSRWEGFDGGETAGCSLTSVLLEELIEDNDGSHCLDDRNGARNHARVVTTTGCKSSRRAVVPGGILRLRDGRR